MCLFRAVALNGLEKVRVKDQLQDVAWCRLALQLGVRDLVGEFAQQRRNLYPLEEIGVTAPHASLERALKDDIGAALQRLYGCPGGVFEGDLFLLDLDDAPSACL